LRAVVRSPFVSTIVTAVVTVILTTMVVVVVEATLGKAIKDIFPSRPTFENIVPVRLIAGEEFDIQGKNLDVVEEVILTRGTLIRIRIPVRNFGKAGLAGRIPQRVRPDDYNLIFWTKNEEPVSTGKVVNVNRAQ